MSAWVWKAGLRQGKESAVQELAWQGEVSERVGNGKGTGHEEVREGGA